MSSADKEKIDELITKVRGLGEKVKSTRAELGSPLIDRIFERVNRISAKLPAGNGHAVNQQQPPQPQEPKVVCPRCGRTFLEDIAFCSGCGFSFQEQRRKQQRAELEKEKCERDARMGVVS